MKRLLATMRCDLRLQMRNGLYAATLFVSVIWAAILLQAGALDLRWLFPPLVIGNLLIGTFYFMGGMVLLEKGEGTLSAQVATPLRSAEYLAAKLATLSVLALAETLVIVAIGVGAHMNPLPLIAGVALAAAIYCLAGFIVVARYATINEYLLPSGAYVAVLWVPLLAYALQWRHWLLYLHPLSAPLALVEAAFEPAPAGRLVYGLVCSIFWLMLLGAWSQRAFRRWMIE